MSGSPPCEKPIGSGSEMVGALSVEPKRAMNKTRLAQKAMAKGFRGIAYDCSKGDAAVSRMLRAEHAELDIGSDHGSLTVLRDYAFSWVRSWFAVRMCTALVLTRGMVLIGSR